jgi:hypothetical protein
MAATAGHRLTLDPMGKYSNAFFSETTNMIKVLRHNLFYEERKMRTAVYNLQCTVSYCM